MRRAATRMMLASVSVSAEHDSAARATTPNAMKLAFRAFRVLDTGILAGVSWEWEVEVGLGETDALISVSVCRHVRVIASYLI